APCDRQGLVPKGTDSRLPKRREVLHPCRRAGRRLAERNADTLAGSRLYLRVIDTPLSPLVRPPTHLDSTPELRPPCVTRAVHFGRGRAGERADRRGGGARPSRRG